MRNIERVIGAAGAGIVAILAVLLLAKPLLEAFTDLAKEIPMPVNLIVGLILLAIAGAIFQKMTRR